MDAQGSLDANVVLRLLVKDVPTQHQAARRLLERGKFRVETVALAEVCFVLGRAYGLNREQQAEAIGGFVMLPQIDADDAQIVEALAEFRRRPKLSFEDCLLVAAARARPAEPLWTFDRKLANQSAARLVAHT